VRLEFDMQSNGEASSSVPKLLGSVYGWVLGIDLEEGLVLRKRHSCRELYASDNRYIAMVEWHRPDYLLSRCQRSPQCWQISLASISRPRQMLYVTWRNNKELLITGPTISSPFVSFSLLKLGKKLPDRDRAKQ
jgi:hypothetical protein